MNCINPLFINWSNTEYTICETFCLMSYFVNTGKSMLRVSGNSESSHVLSLLDAICQNNNNKPTSAIRSALKKIAGAKKIPIYPCLLSLYQTANAQAICYFSGFCCRDFQGFSI